MVVDNYWHLVERLPNKKTFATRTAEKAYTQKKTYTQNHGIMKHEEIIESGVLLEKRLSRVRGYPERWPRPPEGPMTARVRPLWSSQETLVSTTRGPADGGKATPPPRGPCGWDRGGETATRWEGGQYLRRSPPPAMATAAPW